ncbi:MAG: DNA-methyltransferase [Ilumatobacteraceae bacterium]
MPDDTPLRATRARRTPATSSFGASRREGHDSSAFYARFRAPEVSDDDTIADPSSVAEISDRIFVGDSRDMGVIPDASVGLVVTSPPYFAGKAYEEALGEEHIPSDYVDYLTMLREVFAECVRVLEPGGRIVVNVANLGRRPFRSLAADVTDILQDDLGLLLRGEVVWMKQRGSSGSCAWGSYRSPTNPVLRDTTERLVIASKGRFDRALSVAKREKRGLPFEATVSGDEFMEATLDVWEIAPESATRVNHPAPFPVSLVERCIHLYSFAGDLVLDPFMGSGSTALAARRTGRRFVGFDTDPTYVELAHERLSSEVDAKNGDDIRTLRDIVDASLRAAGFGSIDWGVKVAPGLEVSGRARSADGREMLFDLAGGHTSVRPGLQRGELVWRTLGRAAAVNAVTGQGLVVFTTGLPERASGGAALDAVVNEGTVRAVIDALSVDVVERISSIV